MTTTMTTRTATRVASAAALALSAMLALSACGGSDDAKDGSQTEGVGDNSESNPGSSKTWEYDFSNTRVTDDNDIDPVAAGSSTFTVTIPDELKAAKPSSAKTWLVDSYNVTTKAFDSGICRADVTVNFASGGQQAITTPGLSSRSGVELVSGRLMGVRYGTTVDKVPSDDELGTQGGLFLTEDYSKIAIVNDCSGPEDQAAFVDLRFPYLKDDGDDDYMAEAGVSVYQGGQSGAAGATTMITGSTQNVDISVTGDWVAEDPEEE
ncbi:hypothetical protein [Brevibacterium sp. FME37]|uniref:hypothetical protein n=1 Tax=Brevibacterium sp. FME37 TaxID=2742607 RepID=UPI00186804BE|nr:hypothetical protein [Brevibacterium sp. FME37]